MGLHPDKYLRLDQADIGFANPLGPSYYEPFADIQDGSCQQKVFIVPYTPSAQAQLMPFCVEAAAYLNITDTYVMPRADLSSYQLLLTTKGMSSIEVGGRVMDCSKGSVVLLDCRQEYICQIPDNMVWGCRHIRFNIRGGDLLAERGMGLIPFAGEISNRFDKLFRELTNPSDNSIYILSHMLSGILTEIVINKSINIQISPHFGLVETIASYLREHYTEKISIEEIAKSEYISKFYLIRIFKEFYGVSPYEYLVRHRINMAKEMIIQGLTYEKIAQNCGLGTINNFYRIFKKQTGVTPNQYKAQYHKKTEESR